MRRESITSDAPFCTPVPRSGRRVNKRVVGLLGLLVTILFVDAVWLHLLIWPKGSTGSSAEAVEEELVKMLMKQKEALEAAPPLEEIQAYADRFKVLLVS
jgi:hypothetical protein